MFQTNTTVTSITKFVPRILEHKTTPAGKLVNGSWWYRDLIKMGKKNKDSEFFPEIKIS